MHIPERMCVVCRQRFPRKELRRFVFHEGKPCFDEKQTLPGRGCYVCADPRCEQKFAKYTPRAKHKGA